MLEQRYINVKIIDYGALCDTLAVSTYQDTVLKFRVLSYLFHRNTTGL